MRVCPRCNKSKSPKHFYGEYLYCKECKRKEYRNRYAPRKEALRLRRLATYDDRGYKQCKNCKKFKPVDSFSPHPTHWDRLSHVCKQCVNEHHKIRDSLPETKERRKVARRNWYIKNRTEKLAKNAKWRKDNPDKSHAIWHRYIAKKRGADGSHTATEWKALREFYSPTGLCLCCKRKRRLTKDHVIPLMKHGTNSLDNLQPLCQSCNSKKGDELIVDYRPDKGAYARILMS